jgi:hypothetical protein
MIWLNTILVLIGALLAVFWQTAFHGFRHFLGAQIDLLPALMVYASLSTGFVSVVLLAICGGLWFDSLSANPLGLSVLPLLFVGVALFSNRDLVLRDQLFARFFLGFVTSMVAPAFALVLLLTTSQNPLLGWGTVWQFLVMSIAGGIAAPLFFEMFDLLNRLLGPVPVSETSFRSDREIRRGR